MPPRTNQLGPNLGPTLAQTLYDYDRRLMAGHISLVLKPKRRSCLTLPPPNALMSHWRVVFRGREPRASGYYLASRKTNPPPTLKSWRGERCLRRVAFRGGGTIISGRNFIYLDRP
jgi:hypothetical protein